MMLPSVRYDAIVPEHFVRTSALPLLLLVPAAVAAVTVIVLLLRRKKKK